MAEEREEQKRPSAGGAASRRARGLVGLFLSLTPEQRGRIHAAANLVGSKGAAFAASAALEAAEKVLAEEAPKKSTTRLDTSD
jgi:uncharacterized protein (DUF1778 family)